MKIPKIIIPLLIIYLLVFIGHYYLFKPGIFPTEDGEKLIIRFASFHQALRDGQIPPRWAGNLFHGFGYPVFIFLYPGLLIFWEIIRLLTGLSLESTVKVGLFSALLFSGFGMFFLLREFFDDFTATIAASIYPLLPYIYFDLYMRGSFGEVTGFSLIPFLFLAIIKFLKKNNIKWFLFGSLFWAGLLLVHNVEAILFSGLCLLYISVQLINLKKRTYLIFLMPVFAASLGSFFLMPAFWERIYTIFYQTPVANPSGYFLSIKTNFLVEPYHYGILYLFIMLLGIVAALVKKTNKNLIFFFIAVCTVSIIFSMRISQSLWNLLSLATYVQFPYRFLSLVTFSIPFLAASFLGFIKNKYISVILLLVFLLISLDFFRPTEGNVRADNYYLTNMDPTTSANEYLPENVKDVPDKMPKNKLELKGNYLILNQKSNLLDLEIESYENQIIKVNTFYYPGWKLFINNEIKPIIVDNKTGLIKFRLDKNKFKVSLRFEKTNLRIISEIITLISFAGLIVLVFASKKNSND